MNPVEQVFCTSCGSRSLAMHLEAGGGRGKGEGEGRGGGGRERAGGLIGWDCVGQNRVLK